MTITEASVDRLDALDAKIDHLSDQLAVLTADVEMRRRQRERFDELTADLAQVGEEAMVTATRELETLSQTADLADTVRLLKRLVEVAPTLDRALVTMAALADFLDDAAPLGTDVLAMATDRLAEAERKGYFAFGSAVLGVADRVVTSYDEHDVELLGDNVVAMLDALREITQPEMLAFLRRMVDAVQVEQAAVELEPADPPSLLSLARQLRDPEVRRGMARALHTLRTVSVETGPGTSGTRSGARTTHPPQNQGDPK